MLSAMFMGKSPNPEIIPISADNDNYAENYDEEEDE